MPSHPLDIGPSYAQAFRRPEDALREQENEKRKADLQERIEAGTQDHEGIAAFAEAMDAEIGKYAVEPTTAAGGERVNDAISEALAGAQERVQAASMTSEQRLAKAIAQELRGQAIPIADDFYVDGGATPEETAALEAELEADEDPIVGTDAEGNTVYMNQESGEQYILVHG
jgi:hypothetical protein